MALRNQSELASQTSENWMTQAFGDLADRLTPPSEFPCTFSQNAFRRELLQFSFVDTPGEKGWRAAARDLKEYVSQCRGWDGRVDSARPLVMVFSQNAASFDRLEDYHDFGWQVLQYWHDNDPAPWPDDVAKEPVAPFWSFCYDGMQLFVNMSAPLHHKRRSRNLGRYFILVINPRERFDIVAGATPEGQKLRNVIRARSAKFDGMEHSPYLGSYHKAELEWVQYALTEDNREALGKCPLHSTPNDN